MVPTTKLAMMVILSMVMVVQYLFGLMKADL